MAKMTIDKNGETGELTLTRVFSAPADKVWQAWADPKLFAQWWGPRGWETTVKEFDLKPGGTLLYGMKCVDKAQGEWFGKESWGKMLVESVNEPHEFTYTDYFSDPDGNVNKDMPASPTSIRFEPVEGGTKVVSTTKYQSAEALQKVLDMGMEQGVAETWDRLEELLTK